ncbi:S41 family peptidase [Mucilaginibacter sp. 22184]|uniref:S41 family peptidase n=1 Tax=Mucilaginibacter sp. 22184 TaxID=3453887 RepID=UPI003F86C99F
MKTNFKPVFTILLFLCAILMASGCYRAGAKKQDAGADTAGRRLSVKAMHDDLGILWSVIEEMHPAYGVFTSRDSMRLIYNQVVASINQPLSAPDFIAHVYPFISNVRCGHTQVRLPVGYKPSGPNPPHLLFEVLVKNHHAWITTHHTHKLATGDEIISMNNTPVAAIVDHGYDLYAGDGYNETFKEVFLSEYGGFEDACNKYYHWQPPYRLTLRNKQGQLKTVTLDALTPGAAENASETKANNLAAWTAAKGTGHLALRFLKNSSTAWFVTQPYQYVDTNIYKEAFKQIRERKIKNLILDMRHNTGGDIRVAIRLLSFLADNSFYIVKDVKARIPNPAVSRFERYFDTARTSSFNEGFEPGPEDGTYYHIKFKPTAWGQLYGKLPLFKSDHYTGKLYVLIDGATFSSAALFTAALRAQRKNVVFIGRETAGNEQACSGGTIQHLTLPNTRVIVDFPWMRFVSAARSYSFGRGIMPDYPVEYSPQDIVNNTDPDLKKALSLIR